MDKLTKKLEEIFGIDIRALAMMRVGFSIIVLLDLFNQSHYIKAFYSDQGVMPRIYALHLLNGNAFSLYLLNGSVLFQCLLFLIAAVFALGLLLGYKTRLCSFMTWLFLFSLHNRNLFLLNAGDRFCHICLFWCMFLPLGACYSIDSLRKPGSTPYPQVSSMGTAAYLLQVAFFYSFAGFLKTDPEWTTAGTAMYYVLNVDQFGTPFAHVLLHFPVLLKFLTITVLWIERLAPVLFFLPFWTTYARLLSLGSFIFFQVGLLLVMNLQFFQWICLVSLCGLIPSYVLDKIFGPWPAGQFQQKKEYMPVPLSLLAAFLIVYVFFWNLNGMEHPKYRMPHQMQWVGYLFGIDQHWGMFAPRPMRNDGWYVMPGRLRDGSIIDIGTEKAVTWEKPSSIYEYGKDHRWILYHLYIGESKNAHVRIPYGKYLCNEWNASHPYNKKLMGLEAIYMEKDARLDQEPYTHPTPIVSFDCTRKREVPVFKKGELPGL